MQTYSLVSFLALLVIVGVFAQLQPSPDPCTSTPCENEGTCAANVNMTDYTCQCQTWFTGKRCDIVVCSERTLSNFVDSFPDVCGCNPNLVDPKCGEILCSQMQKYEACDKLMRRLVSCVELREEIATSMVFSGPGAVWAKQFDTCWPSENGSGLIHPTMTTLLFGAFGLVLMWSMSK